MIPEAPFFFSVAALSVTLAGFSGLVAALRRGGQLRAVEVFHLRGIAEVGLANALIALSTVPIAQITGDTRTAVGIGGAIVIAYVVAQIPLFALRLRRMAVPVGAGQAVGGAVIDVAAIGLAVATIATRSVGSYEAVMLLLLARPMWDFVLFLRGMAADDPRPGAEPPSST